MIKLSCGAEIVILVLQYAAFSNQCNTITASEIIALIQPIFGDELIKEALSFYKLSKRYYSRQ